MTRLIPRDRCLETFLNHVQRIFRQLQPRQFFPREPPHLGGVAGCGKISRNPAAQKINQNIVILHALFGIAQNAVVDAEQFAGFDDESGFFASLAHGGFAHQFADFEHASGDRPLVPAAAGARASPAPREGLR